MARLERISGTDIDTMPLIRVSIEHGTEGLKRRTQTALARAGLADNELIQACLELGPDIHSGDRRTYEPYSGHLYRATIRAIEDFGITDPEVIAAEPMHDSIEDHPEELIRRFLNEPIPADPVRVRELGLKGLEIFAAQYGSERMPKIVWSVSTPVRPKHQPKIPWYLNHSHKIVILGEPEESAAKTVDFTDNVDTPTELEDPNKRAYLDMKQVDAYPIHIAGLQREDSIVPPENRDAMIELLAQKQAEAHARLRARGIPEIAHAANSLRTA